MSTINALRKKRNEIRGSILAYQKRLKQAQADLAHVSAAISIFEGSGEASADKPYVDVHRIFEHGEMIALAKQALVQGPMDTREIAFAVMKAKGLNAGDKVLAKAVCYRLIHALRMQCHRGKIADGGKRRGVRVWALPESK